MYVEYCESDQIQEDEIKHGYSTHMRYAPGGFVGTLNKLDSHPYTTWTQATFKPYTTWTQAPCLLAPVQSERHYEINTPSTTTIGVQNQT
jgi:hypothetical protein